MCGAEIGGDSVGNVERDVLMFIGRFSTDGQGTRWEVVECFTQGCCYWFAFILKTRFDEEYGAEIVVNYVANHFGCRICGRVYDATGDVTEKYDNWYRWDDCDDEILKNRITEYCIMF